MINGKDIYIYAGTVFNEKIGEYIRVSDMDSEYSRCKMPCPHGYGTEGTCMYNRRIGNHHPDDDDLVTTWCSVHS